MCAHAVFRPSDVKRLIRAHVVRKGEPCSVFEHDLVFRHDTVYLEGVFNEQIVVLLVREEQLIFIAILRCSRVDRRPIPRCGGKVELIIAFAPLDPISAVIDIGDEIAVVIEDKCDVGVCRVPVSHSGKFSCRQSLCVEYGTEFDDTSEHVRYACNVFSAHRESIVCYRGGNERSVAVLGQFGLAAVCGNVEDRNVRQCVIAFARAEMEIYLLYRIERGICPIRFNVRDIDGKFRKIARAVVNGDRPYARAVSIHRKRRKLFPLETSENGRTVRRGQNVKIIDIVAHEIQVE